MPGQFAEQEFGDDGTGSDEWRKVSERLDAGSRRMRAIEDRLAEAERQRVETQRQLAQNTEVTLEIHSAIAAAKTGFKVLGLLGDVAKWLAAISGAALSLWALYQAFKAGGPPHK
jgi:hypothetical protein